MVAKSVVRKRNTDPTNASEVITCPSCDNLIRKNFCEECGEKKLSTHDFSIRHFLEEIFEGFTHFDNKFFRTAYFLIFKPGHLSIDFCAGRRVPYMKPFPMFIICNILFFLSIGEINIFAQPLNSFYQYKPYINFGTREIILSLVKSEAEFRTLAIEFNQRMGVEAKAFLALFIPVLSLGSMAVFYRRRNYFSEHLVFSTHFFTFTIILDTVWALFVVNPFYKWIRPGQFDSTFDLISSFMHVSILGVYFYISSRRFYNASHIRSVVGSVVIALIFLIGLMAYRMILFYKIIYSLH